MTIDSITYLLTVFTTFLLCWFTRLKYRYWILVIISILFIFLINPKSGVLFITLSLINYITLTHFDHKKFITTCLVVINLSSLAIIKYILPVTPLFRGQNYLIPAGISIFIFQQISFIMEFKKERTSLRHFLVFSLFMGNIATGPIQNFKDFTLSKKTLTFSRSTFILAVIYICLGFFKKLVVADNLSAFTQFLYRDNIHYEANLLIPFLLNKYEIYANFSGFTDIAIGVGYLFGIHLPQNFNRPFAVASIVEFWRRWHMSLVAWIREYVFYPLATSRINVWGPYPLMAITFLIFAIWHAFALTNIVYALIQVLLIYMSFKLAFISKYFENKSRTMQNIFHSLKWFWFYIILISIPGILFRSPSLSHFGIIMQNLISTPLASAGYFIKHSIGHIWIAITGILLLEAFESRLGVEGAFHFIKNKKTPFNTLLLLIFLTLMFLLCHNYSSSGFIYSNY